MILPTVSKQGWQYTLKDSTFESETILGKFKSNKSQNLIKFQNKEPKWNDEKQANTLNFFNRATEASVKNFTLVDQYDDEKVYMLKGKMS